MRKILDIVDKVIKIILNVFLALFKIITSCGFINLVVSYITKTGDYEYLRYPDAPVPYQDSLVSICLVFYVVELLLSVSFFALNLKRKWPCIIWGVLLLLEGITLFAFLTTT